MMTHHKGFGKTRRFDLNEIQNQGSTTQDPTIENLNDSLRLNEIDLTLLSLPELEKMLLSIDTYQIEYQKEATALMDRQIEEVENLKNGYLTKQFEILELMKSTEDTSELSEYSALYDHCSSYLKSLNNQVKTITQQYIESVNKLNLESDRCRKIVEKLILNKQRESIRKI